MAKLNALAICSLAVMLCLAPALAQKPALQVDAGAAGGSSPEAEAPPTSTSSGSTTSTGTAAKTAPAPAPSKTVIVNSTVAAAAPGPAGPPGPASSPLLSFFNSTANLTLFNASIYDGFLAQYLSDPTLTLTVFAPTDAAMNKRFNSLGSILGLGFNQFFDSARAVVLGEIIKYHFLPSPVAYNQFFDNTTFSTLSNLCSNAKNLRVFRSASGTIQLDSAGGVNATIIGNTGYLVGGASTVYLIDDVLLPDVVTIPLAVALTGNSNAVNGLATATNLGAPAPPAAAPASATAVPPSSNSAALQAAATSSAQQAAVAASEANAPAPSAPATTAG